MFNCIVIRFEFFLWYFRIGSVLRYFGTSVLIVPLVLESTRKWKVPRYLYVY